MVEEGYNSSFGGFRLKLTRICRACYKGIGKVCITDYDFKGPVLRSCPILDFKIRRCEFGCPTLFSDTKLGRWQVAEWTGKCEDNKFVAKNIYPSILQSWPTWALGSNWAIVAGVALSFASGLTEKTCLRERFHGLSGHCNPHLHCALKRHGCTSPFSALQQALKTGLCQSSRCNTLTLSKVLTRM